MWQELLYSPCRNRMVRTWLHGAQFLLHCYYIAIDRHIIHSTRFASHNVATLCSPAKGTGYRSLDANVWMQTEDACVVAFVRVRGGACGCLGEQRMRMCD